MRLNIEAGILTRGSLKREWGGGARGSLDCVCGTGGRSPASKRLSGLVIPLNADMHDIKPARCFSKQSLIAHSIYSSGVVHLRNEGTCFPFILMFYCMNV